MLLLNIRLDKYELSTFHSQHEFDKKIYQEGTGMFYRVTAHLKNENAADYLRKLTDGTIKQQKPDGSEIVAAMHRAVVNDRGQVLWSETCYCPTPLAHERATVLDKHFDSIETEEIERHLNFEGRPFMNYLTEIAEGKNGADSNSK